MLHSLQLELVLIKKIVTIYDTRLYKNQVHTLDKVSVISFIERKNQIKYIQVTIRMHCIVTKYIHADKITTMNGSV